MKFSSTQSFKTFFLRILYFIPEFHSSNPLRKLERIKVLPQPEFHLFQLLVRRPFMPCPHRNKMGDPVCKQPVHPSCFYVPDIYKKQRGTLLELQMYYDIKRMCLGTFSRRARSLATVFSFARVRIPRSVF